tara:strand:- start:1089 stop:2015 length:927 start_codon:yes stop_codon:yes gene_type:complete
MRATKRQDLDVVLLGRNMADVEKAFFAPLVGALGLGGAGAATTGAATTGAATTAAGTGAANLAGNIAAGAAIGNAGANLAGAGTTAATTAANTGGRTAVKQGMKNINRARQAQSMVPGTSSSGETMQQQGQAESGMQAAQQAAAGDAAPTQAEDLQSQVKGANQAQAMREQQSAQQQQQMLGQFQNKEADQKVDAQTANEATKEASIETKKSLRNLLASHSPMDLAWVVLKSESVHLKHNNPLPESLMNDIHTLGSDHEYIDTQDGTLIDNIDPSMKSIIQHLAKDFLHSEEEADAKNENVLFHMPHR